MTATTLRTTRPIQWRGLAADSVLAALLIGPVVAPFLLSWGWFVPRTIAGVVYTMGAYVCPQPTRGPALYEAQIMAVCMRCYGTLLGLLATRLFYAADEGASCAWLPRYGLRALPVFAALIFAYPAELAGQVAGLWRFDNIGVTAAGILAGVGLGLMFHPILQRRQQSVISSQ